MADNLFKRPSTVQQAVLKEIRNRIVQGVWPPGSTIRQGALAELFGMSRIPIREALKTLEGEGLVEYRPGRGFFVTRLDPEDLKEIYHILSLLEIDAVRHAVPKMDQQAYKRIWKAMTAMENTDRGDYGQLVHHNRRFHFEIYEMCGMPRLIRMMGALWDASEVYQSMYYMIPGAMDRICAEHRDIYLACREKRTEDVGKLLATHRNDAIEQVVETINQSYGSAPGTPRQSVP